MDEKVNYCMQRIAHLDRITFDPTIMGGKACIRGMRLTVSLLLNLVANGMSTDEIIDVYPYIEPEDVHQALQYAAWLAEDTAGEDETTWLYAASHNPAFHYLHDPAEDIYSITDGQSIYAVAKHG